MISDDRSRATDATDSTVIADDFPDDSRGALRHGRRVRAAHLGDNDLVGKQLGPYWLKQLLAVGGMAEVYRARDLARQRVVAVKVLASHLAEDTTYANQFRDEARRAERLRHPHVVPIYDLGEDVVGERRAPYLVMPLMRRSLSQRLRREGSLPYLEALRLTLEAADGLQAAHEAGLIHCDVKPGNILLDVEDHALLCDFGVALDIARAVAYQEPDTIRLAQSTTRPASRETQEWVAGTPAYMAPEQLCGGVVDQRADIYSLGVVLYQLLTGRRPFEGETPLDIARHALRDPIAPPSTMIPDRALPLGLDRVLLSALARDPRDRFSTMSEFAAELRHVRADPVGSWDAQADEDGWDRWPATATPVPVLAHGGSTPISRAARFGRTRGAKRLLCVAAIAASLACAAGVTTLIEAWGVPGRSGAGAASTSLAAHAPEAHANANTPNVVITPQTPTPGPSNSGGSAIQSNEAALIVSAPSQNPPGHGHGHGHGHDQGHGSHSGMGKGHWRDSAPPAHGHPRKSSQGVGHGGNPHR